MYDLREKLIVLGLLGLLVVVLMFRAKERRQRQEVEFRQAWDTIGDTIWRGLNRG